MSTIRIASSTAKGGGTGSEQNPWTIQEAGKLRKADEAVAVRGGTYVDLDRNKLDVTAAPVVGGSGPTGRAVFSRHLDEKPIFNGTFRIAGVPWLSLRGLAWDTPGNGWILDQPDAPARCLEVDGCAFTSKRVSGGGKALFVHGDDTRIARSSFGDWQWGDMVEVDNAKRVLVEDCDWSQARAVHSLLCTDGCIGVRVRRCWSRNPWARAFLIIAGNLSERVVVEQCAFFDCDWDGVIAKPDPQNDDGMSMRFLPRSSIVRGSVFAHSNKGPNSENDAFIRMQMYSGSHRPWTDVHLYHNTFYDAFSNALSWTRSDAYDGSLNKVIRAFNNVVCRYGKNAFRVGASGLPWQGWQLGPNLVWDPSHPLAVDIKGEGEMTLKQAQDKWPAVFNGSLWAQPSFVDATFSGKIDGNPSAFSLRDLEAVVKGYTLATGSPGLGSAQPVTKLSGVVLSGLLKTSGLSDVVEIEHPYAVTDGQGILGVQGDRIFVGSNGPVEILKVENDGRRLTLSAAVGGASGMAVWLEQTGRAGSLGIYPLAGVPVLPPVEQVLWEGKIVPPLPAGARVSKVAAELVVGSEPPEVALKVSGFTV